jgi:cytochrome c oxidase cbb3-type subunit 1
MIPATSTLSETDPAARRPLGLLIASALLWLVLSGVLALIATIQLHTPSFLASCPQLTHGRLQALQESVFVYGWAANAGFAVAIWILHRLGGSALRGGGLSMVGTLFWNLGVTIGLIGIATGDMTGVPFLQLPRYAQPLLLVAYVAIATPGILAWTGRREGSTFAAQWYAVAALFLFPWIYSAAQMLLIFAPVHGTVQAVVAAWFAESAISLWLIPVALATAYYLVPKITGQTIANYDFAVHGFWTLIFVAPWTGARQLVGGPVPVWIPTMAVVCATLVLFHFLIVTLNLRAGLCGGRGNAVLSFVSFGLLSYLIGGIVAAVVSFHAFAETLQFTFFTFAQLKFILAGAFSLTIFGAIYFLLPRTVGIEWPSSGLIRAHLGLALLGLAVTVICLAVGGYVQGHDLHDPSLNFAAIAAHTKPWLLGATAGEALLLLGSLVLTVHFFRLQCAACCASRAQAIGTLEASAS